MRLEGWGRPVLRDAAFRSQVYAGYACYGTAPQDDGGEGGFMWLGRLLTFPQPHGGRP